MTDNFEKKVAVDGPVVNAGEAWLVHVFPRPGFAGRPAGLGQRWTVARKREVVLRLLRDEPVQLLSRQLGVEIFRLEQWREKAIGGIDASLKQRKGDPVQAELDSAMKRDRRVDHAGGTAGGQDGDLRPFGAAEVAAMSAATSPGTGLAYGLRRVCAAWGMARSSFYAMTSGQHAEQPPAKRRGPKPAISDQALLVAIEADLEASPWEGEGYRKVWARLRVCRDIRVARKRVLRLMRENNLLSPHRCRRRGGNPHDGEIITHAPNLMWGTDGVRVFTVDDGWGWIFTAVEHWNAECVGWHVCKRGDRFAALQPISMGLAGLYGSTAAGAARGLALRMDHGSQYLSDHFTNQIKFWGIQPSYAFVAEPQTNGVAERFNRTLKEQIIHGRIYRNIAELRDAVRDFVELYNAQWIVEKNGYLSPGSSSSGVARRDLNQARRVRQTCVQGTGCATRDMIFHGWSMRLFQAWQHSATMSS